MRLILLSALSLTAYAAESVRLGLTDLPTHTNYSVDASGPGGFASATGTGSWDNSGRLSVGVYWNNGQPIAPYIGGGVALSGYTYKLGTLDQRLGEFGVFVEPGVSFNLDPAFSIELGAILGLGAASYSESDVGYTYNSTGPYAEIGAVVRPVVHVRRALFFAEVGALANNAHISAANVNGFPGVQASASVKTSGAFYSIGAGLAF